MNPDVPEDFNGDRLERMAHKIKHRGPAPEDINLPRSEAEWDSMMKRMSECGIDTFKSSEIMRERKEEFNGACEIYKSKSKYHNC